MTKIMLVEDDNNLREIYQARLAAEGYDIVAAEDGEAALAIAAKERPSLVITDVMMPKISGFEMLDILRNTDTLHDVKVIMLTALSQAEDNARAGKLGADRYLVKSQVTLEDIVKATHDLLDGPPADATTLADTTKSDEPAASDTPEAGSAIPAPILPAEPVVAVPVEAIPVMAEITEPAEPTPVINVTAPPAEDNDDTASDDATTAVSEAQTPVLGPVQDAAQAELDSAQTVSQEESTLHDQINDFLTNAETEEATTANSPTTAPTEMNLDTQQISQPLLPTVPIDESEAEYAKDDATPDYGNMSVRDTAESPETAAPSPAPAPAAPPITLPEPVAVAEPAPTPLPEQVPEPAPVMPPTQPAGDQVVSNAIDSMMAQTPTQTAAPVLPPSQAWGQPQTQDPAPQPTPEPAPEQPSEESTRVTKKVIAPLDHSDKPTIQQLLSVEEAKNSALQAAQMQAQGQPAQQQPGVQQAPPIPQQPPTSGLNPNSVAL